MSEQASTPPRRRSIAPIENPARHARVFRLAFRLMQNDSRETADVIACGVLATDIRHIAAKLGLNVRLHFLPGGLHAAPDRLRIELQKTIDTVSAADNAQRIVIGYGVCGRGTVGLHARAVPLTIPRVHDCIALFLGSDASYGEQFSKHPGTYYLSAGWVEENSGSGPRPNMGADSAGNPLYATYEELVSAYGVENADYIRRFMESWTRNYTRSAFIDTGVGRAKEHYAAQAAGMAEKFDWEYARLEGTHDLLVEALTACESTEAVLVVPPGAVTRYDAMRRRLEADSAPPTPTPFAPAPAAVPDISSPAPRGIGLGIDAGGTYTDAVLYDFDRQTVLCKAKAVTTHWDYSTGIREALGRLDPGLLKRTSLAAVSTTIATNAIVEDRGQTVGLLVMPPCGWTTVDGFRHAPLALIRGQLEINGTEVEPVDEAQIRAVAQDLISRAGVTAFAVGGYAAHANPSHELQVKAILQSATSMSVTCSHALSCDLHYRIRAETAALNARIIPCLEALLTRITGTLDAVGIRAPVMVVRSDGSFMNIAAALERPLETMLSGPAASAAGAGWLAQVSDALIADIGGTTTDTAVLCGGRVRLNPDGASIGGWQTHIRALDLQTAGLGGDSHVHLRDRTLLIGPGRVAPVSWLATAQPGAAAAFDWLEAHAQSARLSSHDMLVLVRSGKPADIALTEIEQAVLDRLAERPYSLHELTAVLGRPHPSMVPVKRLAARHLILHSGFTPTDALHVAGKVALWDRDAAVRIAQIHARLTQQTLTGFTQSVLTRFERTLAGEILKKEISETTSVANSGEQPLAMALIDRILDRPDTGFRIEVSLRYPVIGIGAPAFCFIPDACARINARPIIPPHADVANAVGAIIGSVTLRHTIRITTSESGWFRLGGVPEAPVCRTIEEATAAATEYLRQHLVDLARHAGCSAPEIDIMLDDSSAPSADGTSVFISRTLEGIATGAPDPAGLSTEESAP